MSKTRRIKRELVEAQSEVARLHDIAESLVLLKLYDRELADPVLDRVLDLYEIAEVRFVDALRVARAARVDRLFGVRIDFGALDAADRATDPRRFNDATEPQRDLGDTRV